MRVYCRNCGIELPDWAQFCDRCGTPVLHATAPAPEDPIEQVEADDTSVEPVWVEPDVPEDVESAEDPADETEFMPLSETQETRLMEAEDLAALESDIEPELPEEPASGMPEESVPDAPEEPAPDELDEPENEPEAEAEPEDAPDEPERQDVPDESEPEEPREPEETPEPARERDASPSTPEPSPFKTIRTIDVGIEDDWHSAVRRHDYDPWDRRTRPSERPRREPYRDEQQGGPNVALIAGLAAIGLFFAIVLAFTTLSGRGDTASEDTETPVTTSRRVSKSEASSVISGLDGWWKTGRTFDGRRWHLQNGLMETYAADGKLAGEILLDPASVERMDAGPADIEGAGYYLRDVGYYLRDDDPDTLHAIAQDGTADEDANLLRTDPPAFVATGDDAKEPSASEEEIEDPSEYLLPEATTRVYTTEELEAMSDHDLFVARNEIYARHGYVFETGELSTYFSSKSWYHPSEVFNEAEISEIERENVSAILAIEQARGSQYV